MKAKLTHLLAIIFFIATSTAAVAEEIADIVFLNANVITSTPMTRSRRL